MELLQDCLVILDNKKAIQELLGEVEPEYSYTEEDIIKLMKEGSLEEFLDCLDFAPSVVKEMIKELSVKLPLNDMNKRQAIQEKLGFDVTKAIEIQNTKYDGETEETIDTGATKRRTNPINSNTTSTAPSGRRYKPITKNE